MSLKRLHSGCLHRASGTLLCKSQVCETLFQRLIVSLHSFTVNPNPSHFPCLCSYHHGLLFKVVPQFSCVSVPYSLQFLFIHCPSIRSISSNNPFPGALRLVLVESTMSLVLWAEDRQLPLVSPLFCSSGNHDVLCLPQSPVKIFILCVIGVMSLPFWAPTLQTKSGGDLELSLFL
jgi:hypothetical protein